MKLIRETNEQRGEKKEEEETREEKKTATATAAAHIAHAERDRVSNVKKC